MYHKDIDMGECRNIFIQEMKKGLAGEDSSLQTIPTYIEVDKSIPIDKPVIVLDAGGTHFRVATVRFDKSSKPIVQNFAQYPMPRLDREINKEEFFHTIVEYLAGPPYLWRISDRIGFCFSYPTEKLANKAGKLTRFCKSQEGRLSAIESNQNIRKNRDLDPDKEQVVNIESGTFGKAPRGTVDFRLDESTVDPGRYTFEKMFSGGYLGGLCLKTLQMVTGKW